MNLHTKIYGGTNMKTKGKQAMKWLLALVLIGLFCVLAVLVINAIMVGSNRQYILSEDEAASLDADCILVLGCGLWDDGTPTPMLSDRCNVGIRLFQAGASERLLMSGDHSRVDYDEVNTMKSLAVQEGIEPDSVFCDHAGFSTYESMYRAKNVFDVKRVIIVTQKYHLYRAIHDARALGLEAYGVSASERVYRSQWAQDIRELLARAKDLIYCIFRPEPTFLGDPIPISGPGSLTDG